jgi:hypothetical protein
MEIKNSGQGTPGTISWPLKGYFPIPEATWPIKPLTFVVKTKYCTDLSLNR